MHTSIDAGSAGTGASTGLRRRLPLVASMVAATLLALPGATLAGQPVDPATLNPPPPDSFHAVCVLDGSHTTCSFARADPPAVALPSGIVCDGVELLDDGQRTVVGKRTYDANGDLVRRHFREDLAGTFTNPITGRFVGYSAGDNILHDLAIPGDVTSGTDKISGRYFRITSGGHTILTDAGTVVELTATGELLHLTPHHPFFSARSQRACPDLRCGRLSDRKIDRTNYPSATPTR